MSYLCDGGWPGTWRQARSSSIYRSKFEDEFTAGGGVNIVDPHPPCSFWLMEWPCLGDGVTGDRCLALTSRGQGVSPYLWLTSRVVLWLVYATNNFSLYSIGFWTIFGVLVLLLFYVNGYYVMFVNRVSVVFIWLPALTTVCGMD